METPRIIMVLFAFYAIKFFVFDGSQHPLAHVLYIMIILIAAFIFLMHKKEILKKKILNKLV